MSEWFNDGINQCNSCGFTTKVYTCGESSDSSFCPLCGSSDIRELDEDIEE